MSYAFLPIDKTLELIEMMYLPQAARRWLFWKRDRPDSILFISDLLIASPHAQYITYGADAYNVAARSGLGIEYQSMGGVNIPVLTIIQPQLQPLATAIRLQGADIDFIG